MPKWFIPLCAAVGIAAALLVTAPGRGSNKPHAKPSPIHRVVHHFSPVETKLMGVMNANGAHIAATSCLPGDQGNFACSFVKYGCHLSFIRIHADGQITVQKAGKVAVPTSSCLPVRNVFRILGGDF